MALAPAALVADADLNINCLLVVVANARTSQQIAISSKRLEDTAHILVNGRQIPQMSHHIRARYVSVLDQF